MRVQPPCPPAHQLCTVLLPRPTLQVRVCVPYTAGSQAPHTRGKPGWPGSWHRPLQAQGLCTCYSRARALLCPPTTPSRLVISMSGQPLQPAVPPHTPTPTPTHTHTHTHTHSLLFLYSLRGLQLWDTADSVPLGNQTSICVIKYQLPPIRPPPSSGVSTNVCLSASRQKVGAHSRPAGGPTCPGACALSPAVMAQDGTHHRGPPSPLSM